MNRFETKPYIIAGPCAAESPDQIKRSTKEALLRNVDAARVSAWKPRTRPGSFEGLGREVIPLLIETAQMGLIPATEVMLPEHAEMAINAVIGHTDQKLLLWLGSRNQNQHLQREIGRIVAGEKRVMLMIKNQPWPDEGHWKGIAEYVIDGGADPSQLLFCHRGFAPSANGFRNTPDFSMAMKLKIETGIPMIIDPSHIGGSVERVIQTARAALDYREDKMGFDGLIVEVHPDPTNALTDAKQQLTWKEFDKILTVSYS